jgi:hypothetical protein
MGAYKKERLLYLIQTALRMNGGTLETNQITRYYPDRDAGKLKVGSFVIPPAGLLPLTIGTPRGLPGIPHVRSRRSLATAYSG